jgi:hypothetical protein
MMSKVDTRGMSPFYQWWHKNCDAMIDDDWSAEEMAGAAWNEAQAQLTTLQQRADAAEGLAKIGKRMANVCFNVGQGTVVTADDRKITRELCNEWDAALAAYKQAQGKGE